MWTIIAAFLLPAMFWFVSKLWLGRYSDIGVLLSPVLSIVVLQLGNYIILGYLDPFILIAVIVQLAIGAATVVGLQVFFARHFKDFKKLKEHRLAGTVVAVLFVGVLLFPLGMDGYEKLGLRSDVDRLMMEDAKAKAKGLVSKRIQLPQHYELEVDYQRKSNYYEIIFHENGELLATIRLDGVTLEELSYTVPCEECPTD